MPYERGPGRKPLPIAQKLRVVTSRLSPKDIATLQSANVSTSQALREMAKAIRDRDDDA